MSKAFSLAELLIAMAIVFILSLIIFPYYHTAQQQLSLQRSVNKLAQDIRRAQEMAMAAEEFEGSTPSGGYGIYLRRVPASQSSYVLFADVSNNRKCDGCVSESGETIEKISFESGIKIKSLNGNHLNIIFKPPDPEVYLRDNDDNDLGSQVAIEICLIDDISKTKTIFVNKAGLIYVE